jgi:hypothetical protein
MIVEKGAKIATFAWNGARPSDNRLVSPTSRARGPSARQAFCFVSSSCNAVAMKEF